MKQKAGIIIPIRNRDEHLSLLLPSLEATLKGQNISYEIILVEQEEGKAFNRGTLINIGAKIAEKKKCTYLVIHDVDKLPVDVDYSYVDKPLLLCAFVREGKGEYQKQPIDYFSGIITIPLTQFKKINGYSNEYWGWGFEDNDLLYRIEKKKLPLFKHLKKVYRKSTTGLKFNGYDSYVKLPMPFGLKNYTFLISVETSNFECDTFKSVDTFPIFSIANKEKIIKSTTSFSYNSFKNYRFTTLEKDNPIVAQISNTNPGQSIFCITVNQIDKQVKIFQDGILKNTTSFNKNTDSHKLGTEFILLGNSGSTDTLQFKGFIDYFAVFNHSLNREQIKTISTESKLGLTEQFEGYNCCHNLEALYDMKISTNHKVFDLSGNNRHGEVFHCDRVPLPLQSIENSKLPYRKSCLVQNLYHTNNGYNHRTHKWIKPETRKNQCRFYNEVKKEKVNINKDGLSTLEYKELFFEENNNTTRIKVSI